MCGFGIDTSVASAEEVQNAMLNQCPNKVDEPKEVKQKTPRQQLIARLNELNIDVNAYAKANNLNGKTDNETFMRLLKELENA
jgi:uncharacterized protein YpmS